MVFKQSDKYVSVLRRCVFTFYIYTFFFHHVLEHNIFYIEDSFCYQILYSWEGKGGGGGSKSVQILLEVNIFSLVINYNIGNTNEIKSLKTGTITNTSFYRLCTNLKCLTIIILLAIRLEFLRYKIPIQKNLVNHLKNDYFKLLIFK